MLNAMPSPLLQRVPVAHHEAGYSLIELLVVMAIMMTVSGIVMTGVADATKSQRTMSNRVQMHAGVRSATELLQQEVGQAGRTVLPGTTPPTLTATVNAAATTATLSSVAGIFVGERLVIDPGSFDQTTQTSNEETVVVSAVTTGTNTITISRSVDAADATIQASFVKTHASGTPVRVYGGFASGVVPPGMTNGSTGTVLKLYGDINGDGNMVYVEYTCDVTTGNLYRNSMPFDATSKPAVSASKVLLENIQANPDNTACFTYMPNPLPTVGANAFVLDVAITLTVRTQIKDPTTGQYQTETKSLLNVSPRNVFHVWQLASAGMNNRVQPVPPTVTALLP